MRLKVRRSRYPSAFMANFEADGDGSHNAGKPNGCAGQSRAYAVSKEAVRSSFCIGKSPERLA
jgi:hypothetical protein